MIYAFVERKTLGFFFQVAVLSLPFQGGTMCDVAHHIWSREPLAASFSLCDNYYVSTLAIFCPNTHMTVSLALDSFFRPGF